MEPGPGRKRRKWDVAAPEGVPANQGMAPAGTPAFGFASPALSNHFIPQGLNPAFALQQPAQPKPLLDVKGLKPGQPLDASLIAKAQAAAAAAVANINKVTPAPPVPLFLCRIPVPIAARAGKLLRRSSFRVMGGLCLASLFWLVPKCHCTF